ncbi:hypothetical protein PINS_up003699 [Pythium insidiosum]|nr:hypothetical protein PINS_up003699 [Pythium insidiosum]
MNKSKSKKQQVQGDQEGEASLIGGVMQAQLNNILVLALDRQVRIRAEAVACVSVLLTQGLVSPLHCIPNLVALETDQTVAIRDTAHAQLVALHEKFPTLLHTPAIQGIQLSYSFQVKVFSHATVFAIDKDRKQYCLLGRLYTNCLRQIRAQRNMFLKALVNQFSDKGSLLASTTILANPGAVLDQLCYLAKMIAALPYDVEDEPLYIVYLINRYVTLKLSSTLQELRKEFAALGIAKEQIVDEDFDLATIDIHKYTGKRRDGEKLKSVLVQSCIAFAINLLIRVKFSLKAQYLLDNEKCHTYQPGNATKATDQPVVLADRCLQMELPSDDDLQCENQLELSWSLLCHTWSAAQEDQHQLDFESHEDPSRNRKKKGRRRKTVAKAQIEDDDDELVEGFDG